MEKKYLYGFVVFAAFMIGLLGIGWLYIIYLSEIQRALFGIEGAWIILMIILIRILLLFGISFYIFREWFKQENQFLSDLPFLFCLFFLFLIYGKLLDLLYNLTFYILREDQSLFILRIRYYVAILTLIPMMYLSIGMILFYFSLKDKYKKLKNKKYKDRITYIILALIVFLEFSIITLAEDRTTLTNILPIIVLISVTTIFWMFYFAYRNKAIPQVNPLILAIGFLVLLIAQISYPLTLTLLGLTAGMIISELLSLCYTLIIFIGFISKAEYEKS